MALQPDDPYAVLGLPQGASRPQVARTPTPTPTPLPTPPTPPTTADTHRPRGATVVAGPVRIRPLPR